MNPANELDCKGRFNRNWYKMERLQVIHNMFFFHISNALPQTETSRNNTFLQLDAKCGANSRVTNYPKYSPEIYNDPEHVLVNNCYAYAFQDLAKNNTRKTTPQPGYKAGLEPLAGTKEDFTCKNIQDRLQMDYKNSLKYQPESDKSLCPCNYRKAALVLADSTMNMDYHFYRQDSDGKWSHKPGQTNVANVDASGKPIDDPATANRDNRNIETDGYNYLTFCSYICIPNSVNSAELAIEASRGR